MSVCIQLVLREVEWCVSDYVLNRWGGVIDFQSQKFSYQGLIREVEAEINNKGWTFCIEFCILSPYVCNRWPQFRMPLELSQNNKCTSLGSGNLPERELLLQGSFPGSVSLDSFSQFSSCRKRPPRRTSQEVNTKLLQWLNHYLLIQGLKYVLAFYLFVITTFLEHLIYFYGPGLQHRTSCLQVWRVWLTGQLHSGGGKINPQTLGIQMVYNSL